MKLVSKCVSAWVSGRIEPPAGSGGIGQAHGVGQRIKATFSVSKSLCRKKIYYCLSTPPMLLGAKHQA